MFIAHIMGAYFIHKWSISAGPHHCGNQRTAEKHEKSTICDRYVTRNKPDKISINYQSEHVHYL